MGALFLTLSIFVGCFLGAICIYSAQEPEKYWENGRIFPIVFGLVILMYLLAGLAFK